MIKIDLILHPFVIQGMLGYHYSIAYVSIGRLKWSRGAQILLVDFVLFIFVSKW